jgi:cell wall-associated NlpC family hydrolase
MSFSKSIKYLFIVTITVLFFSNCSSSSYNQRYKQPKKEDKKNTKPSVRFTSENDSEENLNSADFPEFDEEPVEDIPVDTKDFIEKNKRFRNLSNIETSKEKLLFEILKYIDTPYQYGGETKQGIDCSAFTQQIFKNSRDITLPRTASEQFKSGQKISGNNDLEFGDLVFFDTSKNRFPGHVGIYLGDNLFTHASRSKGITISSLKSSYYSNRFVGSRRIN